MLNYGSNLKLGIGVPWAGQVKAILELSSLVIACKSTLLANFGLVEPMGSKLILKKHD